MILRWALDTIDGKTMQTSDHLILSPCIFWSLNKPCWKVFVWPCRCVLPIFFPCCFSILKLLCPSWLCPSSCPRGLRHLFSARSKHCCPTGNRERMLSACTGCGACLTEEWGRSPPGCWLCPSSLMVFTGPRYEAGGHRAFLPRRETSVITNLDGGE